MNRTRLILAWVAAAALSTALAWGVLSVAAGEVAESPESPVLAVGVSSTASGPSSSSTSVPGDTAGSPVPSRPTSTTTSTSSSSTLANAGSQTPSSTSTSTSTTGSPSVTTIAPTTTTVASTTAPPPVAWSQSTVPTPGGVVVVGHRPGEVRLDSATPAPGFTMEIDKSGPDEVRVEFEGEDDAYEVRARWEDGVFTTEVD